MIETISEKNCKSVFVHNDDELVEAFTNLWTQVINQQENQQRYILQTNDSEI